MQGTYKTIDGCLYEVFWVELSKPKRKELMAKCIESTVRQGEQEEFAMKEENLERNLRHLTWEKV